MTVSVEKAFRDRYPSTMSTESREAGGSRRFTIYLDPSNNIDRTIIRCIEKLGEDIGTQSILRRALIVGVEALSLGEAPILATDIMNDVARTIVDMHKNLGIDDRSPRKNRRRRSAADAVSEARTAFETSSPSAPIVIPAHHSSGEVEDLPHPNDKGEIPNDVDTRHSSASDAADLILDPDSHPATSSDSTPSKEADNIGQKAPEEPDQTAGDPTSSKISPHIPSDGTAEESEASIQVSKPQTSEEAQSVSEGDSPGVSNIPDTPPPPSGGQKLDPAIEAILRKHKAIDVSSTEAEPHSTVAPLTPPGGRTTIHPIGTSANATQTDPQSAQQRGG